VHVLFHGKGEKGVSAFVSIKNVSFAYPGSSEDVLRDYELELGKGEIVGLLGGSGSGKSTLLRLIAGLESPHAGTIRIGEITAVGPDRFVPPERRGLGLVFQDYALFPHLTVNQNIAFGLHRMSRLARLARVDEMLELVQLREYGKRYPHELSGGQQQRAAFARALAPNPALLLMDEPFSNLDAGLKANIREELRQLLEGTNTTSILVTHDEEDAEAICGRIIRMPSPVSVHA
jgi:iron(III) transport system ATP-binding protein